MDLGLELWLSHWSPDGAIYALINIDLFKASFSHIGPVSHILKKMDRA